MIHVSGDKKQHSFKNQNVQRKNGKQEQSNHTPLEKLEVGSSIYRLVSLPVFRPARYLLLCVLNHIVDLRTN